MRPNPLQDARWPSLRELGAEWRQVVEEAREFSATPATKAGTSPGPGAWSAAECYAHLNLTLAAALPELERALASAGPAHREPKLDFWGRLLCWGLDPRRKLKSKATPRFTPIETAPWPKPAHEFLEMHDKLGELLARSIARDLSVTVQSPVAKWVRYSAYSMFRVILVHDRRHQAQARRAIAA